MTGQRDSYNTEPGGDKVDRAGKDNKKKDDKSDVTENRTQNDSQGEVLLTNTAVSNRRVMLMQTATVVANLDQNVKYYLKDSSKRSYITRSLADIIDAKSIGTEYFTNGAFGASTSKVLIKRSSRYNHIRQ